MLTPWITLLISLCLASKGIFFVLIYKILLNNMWLYIEIQFTILVGIINSSFRELNGRLEDVLLQLDQCISNSQKTTLARLARHLSRKFVSICEVMLELNRFESTNLFFHLCILTVNLGITFNIFFRNIPSSAKTEPHSSIAETIWVLFNVIRTLLLVESCHTTRQLISCTRILVGKIMVHVTSDTIQLFEAVETLFKQLILNDISFDVMGICIIDRHVISMVIGVATSLVALTI
nr:uncharacterized protein LOC113395656 isoform X2 [Vanessa tameamea]